MKIKWTVDWGKSNSLHWASIIVESGDEVTIVTSQMQIGLSKLSVWADPGVIQVSTLHNKYSNYAI